MKFVDLIKNDDSLGLVMPYYPAGDLSRYIKTVRPKARALPESVARTLFYQLVKTFQELHRAGILHRDLKLENILVEVEGGLGQTDITVVDRCPEKIKLHLSDFGFAITLKELLKTGKFDSVGTPTYLPYEMLTAVTVNGKRCVIYDQRVDIWCLGVLLYQVLYGTTPFMTEPFDKEKTKGLIRALKFSFPKPHKYPLAEDLISRILVQPRDRLSLD
jgi:serine/threonine protein kinase